MEEILMIKERNVNNDVDYIICNPNGGYGEIWLWARDWNGELYTEATYRTPGDNENYKWEWRYKPVYDENNEIIGFEEI